MLNQSREPRQAEIFCQQAYATQKPVPHTQMVLGLLASLKNNPKFKFEADPSLIKALEQVIYPPLRVFRFSKSKLEDVLQDSIVKVIKNINNYDNSKNGIAWVKTIAMNMARDHRQQEMLCSQFINDNVVL